MKIFQPHPFSQVFRKHTESELSELTEDIKLNGQRQKGIIYEGLLLDGNGRQTACINAKVEFLWKEFIGNREQAINEVKSLNLCRKHLTDDERACAGAEILKLYPATNSYNAIKRGLNGRMLPKVAKEMKVSQHKMRDAVYLRNYHPDKFEACKNGELPVSKTARSIYDEKKVGALPTVFWGDSELSEHVASLSKQGIEMKLECLNGSFFCLFYDQKTCLTNFPYLKSDGREKIKPAIVWALTKFMNPETKVEV